MRQPGKKKALPPPRVRKEPPTIEEAASAACDITTDLEQQVAFAAGLMDVPEETVRPAVLRLVAERAHQEQRIASGRFGQERLIQGARRDSGPRRVVVVERRSRFAGRAAG